MQKSILLAENLSYEISATRTLFKDVRVSVQENSRIALAGCNGVGKSTLLKILAGQVCPSAGSVVRNGSVYYSPQISAIPRNIKASTVVDFLSTISDEWWLIEEILQTRFTTMLDLSLSIASLSGGELTKLFLAIALSQKPNLLLLDEPTNHMDLQALESLSQLLNDFNGAFVIVSHKPFFLDRVVNVTWELTPARVNIYGGNFSLYREQKQVELAAAVKSHLFAKKELKRAKTSAVQEQQRAAHSQRNGRQKALSGSMSSAEVRYFENKSSGTAGTAKKKHEKAVAKATQKVTDTKIKTTKVTSIQLEEKSQKRRNLIDVQGASLLMSERMLIENIQLHICSCDRITIAGVNGSGKSSLAKVLQNRVNSEERRFLHSGEVSLAAEMKAIYLDQSYELVNREQTIMENMQTANPDLSYQLLRQQLGHFLFKYDDVNKKASVLSGGELARLAIAIISISEIDLLILDEPTNNLDIETVDQIVKGINEYQGALWVISHDLDFLSRVNITQAYKIKNQSLEIMSYLPSEIDKYYQELLI
jgi:ATPase subunit of ABC transporter with duplicated ATPase domains